MVVIGSGSIGQAIVRRQGAGKSVLLADFNENTLTNAAQALKAAGHDVTTQRVDVSARASVNSLADAAAKLGDVVQMDLARVSSPQVNASAQRPAKLGALRGLVVATPILLAVQGWFGDTVTISSRPRTA